MFRSGLPGVPGSGVRIELWNSLYKRPVLSVDASSTTIISPGPGTGLSRMTIGWPAGYLEVLLYAGMTTVM